MCLNYIDNVIHDENETEQIKQDLHLITGINDRKHRVTLILETKVILVLQVLELTSIIPDDLLVDVLFLLEALLDRNWFEAVAGDEFLLVLGFQVLGVLAPVLAD